MRKINVSTETGHYEHGVSQNIIINKLDTTQMNHQTAEVNGIRIHYVTAGKGRPLVLLHGWPQTWFQWRKIIPVLAEHFTVVAPDMRGYGDSDKPSTGYDKRTMAADIRGLMEKLGHRKFALVGHDRGARVTHRYALDHPNDLTKLVILDILPTSYVFESINANSAAAYWHWFFHQVPNLPEILVGANVKAYLVHLYRAWAYNPAFLSEVEIDEYVRAYLLPGSLKAGFDDYRAGATIDLEHDAKDVGRRVEVPTLVLWGRDGGMARRHDVLKVWRQYCVNVRGEAIPECGHFLSEEQPEVVAKKILKFLK